MIFIDGNNIAIRTFSSCLKAIYTENDYNVTKENVHTNFEQHRKDFEAIFFSYCFLDILNLQEKYKYQFGEVCVAFDSGQSWRKLVYNDYKKKRAVGKEATEQEWFERKLRRKYMNLFKKILKATRFMVVDDISITKNDNEYFAEADDSIAVLVKELDKNDHLIVSVDVDFNQLNENNIINQVRQYHPIDRKLMSVPSKTFKENWLHKYSHIGQGKDGIPSIKEFCILSEDFIKWCKDNHDLDVDNSFIKKIEKNHKEIIKEYEEEKALEDEKMITEGTRKKRRYLTIYKKGNFGEVAYNKFMLDYDNNMELNSRYKRHLQRNKILLDFNYIHKGIKRNILLKFKEQNDIINNTMFNSIKLMKLFQAIGATKLVERINEF